LDGGQHLENQEYDQERTRVLNKEGYKVIRFWNNDINFNLESVLEEILINL